MLLRCWIDCWQARTVYFVLHLSHKTSASKIFVVKHPVIHETNKKNLALLLENSYWNGALGLIQKNAVWKTIVLGQFITWWWICISYNLSIAVTSTEESSDLEERTTPSNPEDSTESTDTGKNMEAGQAGIDKTKIPNSELGKWDEDEFSIFSDFSNND